MSSQPVVLFQSTAIPASNLTLYASPSSTLTIVDKFSGCNTSASTIQITINVVKSGEAVGTTNTTVKTKSILAGESYGFPEIVGQKLGPGDFISAIASATGFNVRGSGTHVAT